MRCEKSWRMFRSKKSQNLLVKCGIVLAVVLAGTALVAFWNHKILKRSCSKKAARWPLHEGQMSLELFRPYQLDIVEAYFTNIDNLTNQVTLDQLNRAALVAQVHSKPYLTAYTHRYEDLKLLGWGGPSSNQESCLRQLEQLVERVERQYEERSDSKDTNLHQLLDTYGWYSSGGFLGNDEWPGSYHECLRLKINSTEGLLATRYCSAAFKNHKWPKKDKLDQILAYRAGVCLPKACDSVRYKNKFELIERLFKLNSRKVDEDVYYLDYLYCLPDEQSTLRLWYYPPRTVAFVGALIIWIALLAAATLKYQYLTRRPSSCGNNNTISIYKCLSVTENIKLMFRTTSTQTERKLVDLNVVEGIKVISMCYVITGHVLMVFSQLMSNGREMSQVNLSNLIFLSANMTPAFAVNVFFSITGILTSYLLFKHSKSTKSIAQLSSWLTFVAVRYIRIMPLYMIVVMYVKFLAKFSSSGPFWDYGTSPLGNRYQCEREPWSWTLLFGANFKEPLEHCIGSAWYLANDFQFFLVAPIFLGLLHKRPHLGKLAIIGAILVTYLLTVVKLATSSADLRATHQFRLDGLKTYIKFLGDTYTQPQYRIPAYLCGLLMGYNLYKHEQAVLSKSSTVEEATNEVRRVEWPKWMSRYCKLSSLAFCSVLMMPIIGQLLRGSKFYTNVSFGCQVPTYNLLFGFTAGLYILLASTGHGNQTVNKFLASPLWKPLSRLNLCVLLINIEVIIYFAQSSTHLLYFDFKTMAALNLFSIVMSYSVAAVVHVLFELPLQNLINNHLLTSLIRGRKEHKS